MVWRQRPGQFQHLLVASAAAQTTKDLVTGCYFAQVDPSSLDDRGMETQGDMERGLTGSPEGYWHVDEVFAEIVGAMENLQPCYCVVGAVVWQKEVAL